MAAPSPQAARSGPISSPPEVGPSPPRKSQEQQPQHDEKSPSHDNTTTAASKQQHASATHRPRPLWRRAYDTIMWVPPRCRWDASTPPKFSMPLNLLFAFAGAFTVANLYYAYPILNILSRDFGVPYAQVAQIPTLAQAGYAIGLALLCPLGDLWPRRPFVLILVFFTATLTIGLCVTGSFAAFSAIQFIIGVSTVTPQLMLPLVGDLAPPHRRAAALSVVVAGLMLGILVARLLSGIVTNYTSWRNIYWMSVGLQYAIFGSLWYCMPDYPTTNTDLNYFKMLWSILVMLTKYPVLVQACLISFFTSAPFTSFWTDLTFLLAGPPYHYSPVIIGLFALIGIAGIAVTPFYARHFIDRFVPLFSVICGLLTCLLGICLGAYLGPFTVAGPVLQAFFVDFGMQSAQIANRTSIYTIEPRARNRVNTAFMVATFFGQLLGTTAGAHLYADAGGWVPSQSYSVASIGAALLLSAARGPWEDRWVGWRGGWNVRKKNRASADGKEEEVGNHLQQQRRQDAAAANGDMDGGDVEKGLAASPTTSPAAAVSERSTAAMDEPGKSRAPESASSASDLRDLEKDEERPGGSEGP